MLIILTLYVVLMWLAFSKFKLVKWGWMSGTVAVLGGAFILAVFLAMFNYLTPSGNFVVVSRVIEVTPNVSGQVTAIPVKPNEPVKAGAILFRIDPTPFQFKVSQLDASLAQARQQVKQLKASYEQASANVAGLTKQLAFNTQRLADMRKLTSEEAMSVFREQDTQVQYETVYAQLQAAKAAQENARLAMESEISGVNTTVAQIEAQLDHARWELDQTTIVAPGDGYVTVMALTVGDRALQARSVMSFIVKDEVTIVGMFSPNGFQTIKPGATVRLVFDNDPGRIHDASIVTIPEGIGQGQVAVSGMLARAGAIGGAKAYPAVISIPGSIDRNKLRVGMPGSATVFADNAGVIGLLMSILVWISSYTAYL
jgi:multidrug resistance efflux pump